jgi:hypothetical protein
MNYKIWILGYFLLLIFNLFGQDTIVLVNGSSVISKVLEINLKDIKYKKYDNLSGPNYLILKDDVETIKYENGTIETFQNSKNNTNTNSKENQENFTKLPELKNPGINKNIPKYPLVKSCEEYNKVQITYLESETFGLNRFSKIFSSSTGGTTFTSLNKLQSNVETSLKMQAAMLGCGVVYVYDRQVRNGSVNINSNFNSGSTPSITITGYCYNNPQIIKDELIPGSFELTKILYVNQNRTEFSSSKILPTNFLIDFKDIKTVNTDKFVFVSFSSVKGAQKFIKKMNYFRVLHVDEDNLTLSGIYQKSNGSLIYFNVFMKRINNAN